MGTGFAPASPAEYDITTTSSGNQQYDGRLTSNITTTFIPGIYPGDFTVTDDYHFKTNVLTKYGVPQETSWTESITVGELMRQNSSGRQKHGPYRSCSNQGSIDSELSLRTIAESTAEVGILFVHGIGNQKPGSVLDNMGKPCIEALVSIAVSEGYKVEEHRELHPAGTPHEHVDATPRSALLVLSRRRQSLRVRLVEAIWSDSFSRPPWWQCLYWALRSLPAAILLLSPDQRDVGLFSDQASVSWKAGLRHAAKMWLHPDKLLSEYLPFLRLLYRLFVAVLLSIPLLVLVARYPVSGPLLLVMLIAYLRSPTNIAGHVMVAASQPGELAKIEARLRGHIQRMESCCDRVIIVAHSQGGFLCHRILSTRDMNRANSRAKSTELVGIGSGLKPIWLLRQLSRGVVVRAAWTTAIAALLAESVAWASVDRSFFAGTRSILQLLVSQGALLARPMGLTQPPLRADVFLAEVQAAIRSLPSGFGRLGWPDLSRAAGSVALALLARRLWKKSKKHETLHVESARAEKWSEFSSYHDLVGRMLLPELPIAALNEAVAVGGHPFRDHVAYFSSSSILPWRIAIDALGRTARPTTLAKIDLIQWGLLSRASRRRVLRMGILTVVSVFTLLPPALAGRSASEALRTMDLNLLVPVVMLSIFFAMWEVRDNHKRLGYLQEAVADAAQPKELRLPVIAAHRIKPAALLMMLAVSAFAVGTALSSYPAHDGKGGKAFIFLLTLELAYLVAVLAGYRVWRWPLVVGFGYSILWHLSVVPPLPHAPAISYWLAEPAIAALVSQAIFIILTVVTLRSQPRIQQSRL